MKISKIKGLRKRLKSLIFKCKFPEQQEEIKINLVAGTQACLDVKSSEKFQKLLEILLFVGNFMNSGSSNLEGSFGFDMKYLPKVSNLLNAHLLNELFLFVCLLSFTERKPTTREGRCFTWWPISCRKSTHS